MSMPRIWSMAITQHAAAAPRVAVRAAAVVAVVPLGTTPSSWERNRVVAMNRPSCLIGPTLSVGRGGSAWCRRRPQVVGASSFESRPLGDGASAWPD